MKEINEKKIEPTLDEPKSDQAIEFQDDFDKTMLTKGITLEEIDSNLGDDALKQKKKIFNLNKMESLVHSDPRLSAVYDKMSEQGTTRYGYHYNETILNIMFNDYVLNDPKYLEKYKQAVPKEKKRRDKSGIKQIRKDYEEIEQKREKYKKEKDDSKKKISSLNERLNELYSKMYESTISSSSGAYFTKAGNKENYESNQIDTENEWDDLNEPEVSEIAKEKKMKDKGKKNSSTIDDSNLVGGSNAKPTYPGGKIVKNDNNNINENSEKMKKKPEEVNKNTEEEESVEETTSASSAAGAGSSYVGYAGPAMWGDGDLTKGKDKKEDKESFWKGGKVIQESNYLTNPEGFEKFISMLNESELYEDDLSRNQKIKFVNQHLEDAMPIEVLNSMSDEDLNTLYNEFESRDMVNEKAKSQAQQKFMGMVHAYQKGDLKDSEVSDEVKKAAKSMTGEEAEDFASTKHDDLPQHVDENPALMALGTAAAGGFGKQVGNRVADNVGLEENDEIDKPEEGDCFIESTGSKYNISCDSKHIGEFIEMEDVLNRIKQWKKENNFYPNTWFISDHGNINLINDDGDIIKENITNTIDNNTTKDKFNFILNAWEVMIPNFNKEKQRDNLISLSDDKIDVFYNTTKDMLEKRGIDPQSIINANESIVDAQENSMKIKPPINTQGSDFPTGFQDTGGIQENKYENIMENNEKYLKDIDKELKLYEMLHKKLQEERKTSSLVMKDRLGDENQKNFKQDIKHSGTKKIIDTTKELEWEDQQTTVKDPQKLGKDIEKQHLKNTGGGESFKNKGNSANNDGDEIPKRNLTDEEANEVDLYRKGQSDWVFDNKPNERYEERMKRDMGDKIYDERQKTMDLEAEAPMYNKDTQPYDKGIKKDQFDKEKSGWNDRLGINENVVTGKYKDDMNKTQFVNFNLKDVVEVNEVNENAILLNLKGMGNSYSSKFELNENINDLINSWDFYLQESKVIVHKPVKKLDESENKNVVINEEFNKMKHLLGYKPQDYIDTKKNKI